MLATLKQGDESPAVANLPQREDKTRDSSAAEIVAGMAKERQGVIAARAKERMKAGKAQDPVQISAQGKTSQEIAKAAGVSHDTVAKVKKLEAKAKNQKLKLAL